ncbi:4'-phosphopantetheinyl transferase family protein [Stackebrandtia albiflava]|nr:4'-phosphopantetheinyl transferase superfamily protein [Stackebrandtia albiflava]
MSTPIPLGECHVWSASPRPLPGVERWLAPEEGERRAAYRRDADRDRFTVGCVVTRVVLAAHLGVSPGEVPLRRDCRCGRPHGRPRLTVPGPCVSVSHSGGLVLVAVSTAGEVGVDVQECTPDPGVPVEAVMSAREAAGFRMTPPRARTAGFYTVWARKEAVLKATGDGLTVPMPHAEVTRPDRAAGVLRLAHRPDLPVGLWDLPVPPGYAGAVALLRPTPVPVEMRDADALLDRYVTPAG